MKKIYYVLLIVMILGGSFLSYHYFSGNKKVSQNAESNVLSSSAAEEPSSSLSANEYKEYYVNPEGNNANSGLDPESPLETIQKALDLAQPGDTITLQPGVYRQDIISKRSGTKEAPITIRGTDQAIVKGGGSSRVIEINHDYLTLNGFSVDGLFGSPDSISGYRNKLIYVQGKEMKDGVNGLKILNMHIANAGDECIRLRYFAHENEIAGNTVTSCGIHDFRFNDGGKNGEGLYIGTAPEQRSDGKNPTADPDESNGNWIHDNTFDTRGNECVDIKEASTGNIVEKNTCTGQSDPESGGMDSRGSGNIFRDNEISDSAGAGIRVGGDTPTDGVDNAITANIITNSKNGGIKVMQRPQGSVCGNSISDAGIGVSVGKYGSDIDPTAQCEK